MINESLGKNEVFEHYKKDPFSRETYKQCLDVYIKSRNDLPGKIEALELELRSVEESVKRGPLRDSSQGSLRQEYNDAYMEQWMRKQTRVQQIPKEIEQLKEKIPREEGWIVHYFSLIELWDDNDYQQEMFSILKAKEEQDKQIKEELEAPKREKERISQREKQLQKMALRWTMVAVSPSVLYWLLLILRGGPWSAVGFGDMILRVILMMFTLVIGGVYTWVYTIALLIPVRSPLISLLKGIIITGWSAFLILFIMNDTLPRSAFDNFEPTMSLFVSHFFLAFEYDFTNMALVSLNAVLAVSYVIMSPLYVRYGYNSR